MCSQISEYQGLDKVTCGINLRIVLCRYTIYVWIQTWSHLKLALFLAHTGQDSSARMCECVFHAFFLLCHIPSHTPHGTYVFSD